MKIAMVLALQSIPFAGVAFTGGEDRDLFALAYLAVLGGILSFVVLAGDTSADLSTIAAALNAD